MNHPALPAARPGLRCTPFWLVGVATPALLGALSLAHPAAAQGITQFQPAGADVRLGNMRDQFTRSFQPPEERTTAPGWTTYASIGVDGAYSDAIPTATGRYGPDEYAIITPTIGIQGQSQRLKGSLFYSPSLREYATMRSQSGLSHNLNASGSLTLSPELAYLDLRAATGVQSRYGGVGPQGTTTLSQQDQIQTTSLSLTPRLQHSFENFGRAELGYTIDKTDISGTQPQYVSPFVTPQANQNLTSTSPYFTFTTGDDWGRFNGILTIRHTQNEGQGVLSHSFNNVETVSGMYALSRIWSVTGSIGHENIAYGGLRPLHINDMTWSGGARVTPDPQTELALSYGSRVGHPSFTFSAATQLSARTRISAQYLEALGTQAENLQSALAGSSIDSSGTSVSQLTGEPIGLNSNFNGSLGGLMRSKNASITLSWLLDREAVSVSLSRDQQTILSNAVAGGPNSSSGIAGSVAWQHDFSEDLQSNTFVQIGKRNASGATSASQDTMTAYMALTYRLSQTLSSHLQYSYTKLTSPIPTQSARQNLVLIGLLKTF